METKRLDFNLLVSLSIQKLGLIDMTQELTTLPGIQDTSGKFTFGETWAPDTVYNPGDYVYAPDRPGFYYVAQNRGTSHSKFSARSGMTEPIWALNTEVSDQNIRWYSIPALGSEPTWALNKLYKVGARVIPTTGPFMWNGTPFAFSAQRFLYEPDWPLEANAEFYDNTVRWRSFLSSAFFLPRNRQKETLFIELYKIIDYLSIQEHKIFSEVLHKFNDREQLSTTTLTSLIGEFGYDYISNALGLTDKELQHLIAYMGLISALKGTKTGLYLVFDLMGLQFRAEEWWERHPKGEPHTWNLYAEIDIAKAIPDMISKVIWFTRNYVYPILDIFEITYRIHLAELDITMAGFVDQEQGGHWDTGWFVITQMAGFADQECGGPPWIFKRARNFDITMAGFVDQEIIISMTRVSRNLLSSQYHDTYPFNLTDNYAGLTSSSYPINPIQTHVQTSEFKDFRTAEDFITAYTLSLTLPAVVGIRWVRVRHKDEGLGWTPWSDPVVYAWGNAAAPIILQPLSLTSVRSGSLLVRLKDNSIGANFVQTVIQIANNPSFLESQKVWVYDDKFTLQTTVPKLPLGIYYIRAQHQDIVIGWTPWSDTHVFTVGDLNQPKIITPSSKFQIPKGVLNIVITGLSAVGIEDIGRRTNVQVSRNEGFDERGIVQNILTPYSTEVNTWNLSEGNYFIRVRHEGETFGWTEWSKPISFEVIPAGYCGPSTASTGEDALWGTCAQGFCDATVTSAWNVRHLCDHSIYWENKLVWRANGTHTKDEALALLIQGVTTSEGWRYYTPAANWEANGILEDDLRWWNIRICRELLPGY